MNCWTFPPNPRKQRKCCHHLHCLASWFWLRAFKHFKQHSCCKQYLEKMCTMRNYTHWQQFSNPSASVCPAYCIILCLPDDWWHQDLYPQGVLSVSWRSAPDCVCETWLHFSFHTILNAEPMSIQTTADWYHWADVCELACAGKYL